MATTKQSSSKFLQDLSSHVLIPCLTLMNCREEFRDEPPVHPELDGDAAVVSVVAGETGCGGMGRVHSLQELLRGSEALGPPTLMAG